MGFGRAARDVWPLVPATLYLSGFLIVVLCYLVGLAFTAPIGDGATFPTLHTVSTVISSERFRVALTNTILFCLIGTPLELLTGAALAFLLFRRFALRSMVRSLFLLPLAVPALVTAIVLLILFDYPGGHVNHLLTGKYSVVPALLSHPINWRGSGFFVLGVSLMGKVWRDMPISMLIILSGLNAIDTTLLEAATTMGAGWRAQFRYIVIPLLIPAVSAVLLLRSIEMWKEFIFPFVLAGRHELLGTLIESLYNQWGAPHEAAVVALVMVTGIVATVFVLRGATGLLRRLGAGVR